MGVDFFDIERTTTVSELSDDELLAASVGGRSSVTSLFELWCRHQRAARDLAVALGAPRPYQVARVAFARALRQVRRRTDDDHGFRPLLLSHVVEVALAVDGVADAAGAVRRASSTFLVFRSLPREQRMLLWYGGIELLPFESVSRLVGLPVEQALLAVTDAEVAFTQAWLRWQAEGASVEEGCRRYLGRIADGAVAPHDGGSLDRCVRCGIIVAELDHLGDALDAAVLVGVLGPVGSRAYQAVIQRSSWTASEVPAGWRLRILRRLWCEQGRARPSIFGQARRVVSCGVGVRGGCSSRRG